MTLWISTSNRDIYDVVAMLKIEVRFQVFDNNLGFSFKVYLPCAAVNSYANQCLDRLAAISF